MRITKISKEGLTAERTPEAQQEQSESSVEAVQQLLDFVGNSIVINEQECRIKSDLKAKGLSYDTDTDKVLIKHLAGTQILLAFERIHGSIFGSQIVLLKKLNEVSGQGRSIEFVDEHISGVKEIYSESLSSWSNPQYLNYLYSQSLIILLGEQIHITNLGVEFLTWMARNGRREGNPL